MAWAQSCKTTPNSCDQGTAYAECVASTTAEAAKSGKYGRFSKCEVTQTYGDYQGYRGTYQVDTYRDGRWSNVLTSDLWWFGKEKKCSSRPEELGWEGGSTAATVNACHQGCMYTSALDASGVVGFSFAPTGSTCTENDAPAPTPATPGGDDDGDGTGGETGPGDGGNPGDGGGDGDGGSNPGGGDGGGDGGTDPGDGDGDGGGTGPGTGPGPGQGDGDGDDPGQPGEDGDALYEAEGDTVEKLYDRFSERVSNAPIIAATKSFFEISVSGYCPVFTLPASAFWDAMTFDFFCRAEILALLELLGWLLLAFAAFQAGKIALT